MFSMNDPRNLDDHTPLKGLSDRELINLVESKGDATPLEEMLVERMVDLYKKFELVESDVGIRIDIAVRQLHEAKNSLLSY